MPGRLQWHLQEQPKLVLWAECLSKRKYFNSKSMLLGFSKLSIMIPLTSHWNGRQLGMYQRLYVFRYSRERNCKYKTQTQQFMLRQILATESRVLTKWPKPEWRFVTWESESDATSWKNHWSDRDDDVLSFHLQQLQRLRRTKVKLEVSSKFCRSH